MRVNSCLSIFYHQRGMHRLLQKLRVLLKQPAIASGVANYFVFISSDRGTSVRLVLQTEEEKQAAVCNYLFTQLESWLRDHPARQNGVKTNPTNLFSDFPNNCIRYNLYSSSIIENKERRELHVIFTELMLNFFGSHPLDEEALYTFSLYLHHHFYQSLDKDDDKTSLAILCQSIAGNDHNNHGEVLSFEAPEEIQFLFDRFRIQCRILRSAHSPASLYNIILTLLKSHLSFLGNELVVNCYSRLKLTNAIYSDVSLH